MKKCFKCGENKPKSEYYRHKAMADGFIGKCKECAKMDATEHRIKNIERVRGYDRKRGFRGANAAQSSGGKKKWRDNNKDKKSATQKACRKHIRKQPCTVCGSTSLVHRHHDDYLKPLDIVWLCPEHHGERHRVINKIQRAGGFVHPNTKYF